MSKGAILMRQPLFLLITRSRIRTEACANAVRFHSYFGTRYGKLPQASICTVRFVKGKQKNSNTSKVFEFFG